MEPVKQWHEHVDVIYYINLDHRMDRNAEFLNEMKIMGVPQDKIIRISGIYKPGKGYLGCTMSHIIAYKMFEESRLERCIIFEDDFHFTQKLFKVNDMFNDVFNDVFNNSIVFDVIMLSANEIDTKYEGYSYLKKVIDVQTASGYIVNRTFLPKLLKNYTDSKQLLEECYSNEKDTYPFVNDIYWKLLQPTSNWYVFSPKIGIQRASYSDNTQKFECYDV
jgi:GR25 family glycosyltransferase involved in LPS biosynthesis